MRVLPRLSSRLRLSTAACAIFAQCIAMHAQSVPQPLVTDLIVRDKKGHPVTDLQPGDIQLLDGNTPVKVTGLRVVSTLEGGPQHLVALLFDRVDPAAAREARRAAEELVKDNRGNLLFAVFQVQSRLRLIQEFTSDADALKKAIAVAAGAAKLTTAGTKEDPEQIITNVAGTGVDASGASVPVQRRRLAQLTLDLLKDSQRAVQQQAVMPSVVELLSLVRGLTKEPGRKAVVFFSGSLQVDTNTRDALLSLPGIADHANVSLYAVNTSAVNARAGDSLGAIAAMQDMSGASQTGIAASNGAPVTVNPGPAGTGSVINEQISRIDANAASDTVDPIVRAALGTGGAYFTNSGDLRKPMHRIYEEMSTWYEASWLPPSETYDGRFHAIRIKVLRPGITVRAPAGYLALPPDTAAGTPVYVAPLLKLLEKNPLPAGLPFRPAVIRFGNVAPGNLNSVVVEIPLSGLQVREDGNTQLYSVRASVLARVKDQKGAVIESLSEQISRHGALNDKQHLAADVLTFHRHFTATPGDYVLETVVMDENGGNSGAQRTPFTIASPAGEPAVSDLVLVRRTEPFDPDTDPSEPLRFEKQRVIPDISGAVSAGGEELSVFFIMHTLPASAGKPRLEMEIRRDGRTVARSPLRLESAGLVPYLASLPVAALAPGHYEVKAILTQGKTVETSLTFTMAGTAAPGSTLPNVKRGLGAGPEADVDIRDTVEFQRKPLTITPVSTAARPLSQADIEAMLHDARSRAIDYTATLPNFMCLEVTHRSMDAGGRGQWRHRDTFAELLRFHDKLEQRTMLQVNGVQASTAREGLKGTISHGEFGGLLDAIFAPDSQAAFHWKEAATIGARSVQVFEFTVPRAHSSFGLADENNPETTVGFHGQVYIDPATHGVRRLNMETDEMPQKYNIRRAQFTVDYDYIAISDHDYLLPIIGTLKVTQRKHTSVLNQIEFLDYRRYGAESTLRFDK